MEGQEHATEAGERQGGRPRSPAAHRAILDATLALLAELGFERMSIEAIAAHAGVGKTTIYRRWKTKEDLVADALSSVKAVPVAPDTGDLRTDIALLSGYVLYQLLIKPPSQTFQTGIDQVLDVVFRGVAPLPPA